VRIVPQASVADKPHRPRIAASRKGVRTLFWGVELGEDTETGRPKRADEAGGIYHALNRGNARSTIFHKPEDYEALE
jgi:hypothetical protein